MIGSFGDIVFETSDKRILNFSNFKRDSEGRWADHEVIGQKPVSEFLGPGLDTITFTVNLNGSFGVNPRNELVKWLNYVRNGNAEILVIGGRPLGVARWTVRSNSEAWDTIWNNGELYSAKVDITLKEYVETL